MMMVKASLCSIIAGIAIGAFGATELVEIDDVGNHGKAMPFGKISKAYPRGAVSYPYRIGRKEVTNGEYTKFLNAAARSDEYHLFNPKMNMVRSGNAGSYSYTCPAAVADSPVNYVSRISAARYCNWLSGGEVYRIEHKQKDNGKIAEVIVGWRNQTDPSGKRLYFLPTVNEFYKAGFYDGKGGYPNVTRSSRLNPSHYGLIHYASGVREWMEDKYFARWTIQLGATDDNPTMKELNGYTHHIMDETAADQFSGFRIAATAPLAFAPRLNDHNNFFFGDDTTGRLRIRYDGPSGHRLNLILKVDDYTGKTISCQKTALPLQEGVNDITIGIPEHDGYYELKVISSDPLLHGHQVSIPLMVARTAMPDWQRQGNFGFAIHITRWEQRFTFEPVDFSLIRQLGASILRVDVQFDNISRSHTALQRIYHHGLRPLGLISYSGINSYQTLAQNKQLNPKLVETWQKKGFPAFAAWYAEHVKDLVQSNKKWCNDWELGNEPTYWTILPEDYAQLAKAGYLAAKSADPDCNITAGDLSVIHAPVLALRAGEFCDSIASHIYGFFVPSFWGIIGKMRTLNGWKAAAGIPDKPVWLTEIGVSTFGKTFTLPVRTLNEVRRYQALHMPKSMAGSLAYGAQKVIAYNFRDVPLEYLEEEFGIIDRYGYPKPAAMSYRTTARILGNARFIGFAKGHSSAPGKLAKLVFKAPDNNDILVLWRNDVYGQNDFSVHFEDLIKPKEEITVPATKAELVTLDGVARKLMVENGRVHIAIDEYPVFVRGRLTPEFADISTRQDIPTLNSKTCKVKILPLQDQKIKTHDLLSGVFIDFTAGQETKVTVHIYNLQNHEITGILKPISPSNWRECPWRTTPTAMKLSIPANGMGSGTFLLSVPRSSWRTPFYFKAIFETADGNEFSDHVACRVVPQQIDVSQWIIYTKGYRLSQGNHAEEMKMTLLPDHHAYACCYLRQPTVLALDTSELVRQKIILPYKSGVTSLHHLSLMLIDRNGEHFQLRKRVKVQSEAWNEIAFDLTDFSHRNKYTYYGGDKNGKIDFPVKFLGFNFEFETDKNQGAVVIRCPEFDDKGDNPPVLPEG